MSFFAKSRAPKSIVVAFMCGIVLYSCNTVAPPPSTTVKPDTTMSTGTVTNPPVTITPPSAQSDTNTSNAALRLTPKILIEKYTGYRCGLCPAGTDDLKELERLNPDKVFAVKIHASSLATPSGEPFVYDFRTSAGNALDNQFRASSIGLPSGMVNRAVYNSSRTLSRGAWGAAVAAQQGRSLDVAINLTSIYVPSNRTVTVRANLEYLKNQEIDNYLSFYIVEDSIIQPQTDYRLQQTLIQRYIHNNVLRGTLNTTWGAQISAMPIQAGTKLTREATYALPTDWNERQISIVAFVHKYNTTWEVLQVEKVRVQKK